MRDRSNDVITQVIRKAKCAGILPDYKKRDSINSRTLQIAQPFIRSLNKYSESNVVQKILSEVLNDNDENIGPIPPLESMGQTTSNKLPGDIDRFEI